MRLFKRLLSALRNGLLLSGSFLLFACQPAAEPPLRVGTNVWPGYEALYLARELGFYPDNTVALKELSSNTEVLRAFRQAQLDIAALTLDETLRMSEQVDDLHILIVTNISEGADKIISQPGIDQIMELKGKRIAVEENSVGIYLLYQALQTVQLNFDDVVLLPSTVNQHLQLMQSQRAHAVVTFDPTAYQLEQLGFNTLFDSKQIDNKIVDVLVCRKSLLTERPQAIRELLAAYWQAQEVLVNSPQQAYPLIAKRLGVKASALPGIYQNLILPGQSLNARLISEDLPAIIDETGQFLIKQGLITNPPAAQALLGEQAL
ncbi:MAG: ABC transporter substrate-binding protein [Methylophaga sp.]|nr:ABC transporter substrate-binding protein [Methylophaga sp.]